jgi:AraC-like DNA-binding protein
MLPLKAFTIESEVIAYTYSKDRTSFKLPSETYSGWVLLACEKGAFQFEAADRSGVARVGEAVLCPPGIALHRKALSIIDFHYIQFRLKVISDSNPVDYPHSGKLAFRDSSRLLSTLAGLREARGGQMSAHYFNHLVNDLLYQYIAEQAAKMREGKERDPAIAEAVRFIHEHAFQNVSMQEAAAHAGLSQSQFTRKFQKEMGISPVKYMTRIRLNKVKQLLAETEDSLETIAEKCGYQNAFYLSRVFSKEMGISPSRYRVSHRV